jgi:SAM-dependent methyltransferase
MNFLKQVDKDHYEFSAYLSKARWNSIWHQLHEVQTLGAKRILEVGPGPGIFKTVAEQIGVHVETLDIDPALKPDHVGSAVNMPLPDSSFDTVCAFQVLEHFPYDESLAAFREMVRVSKKYVVLSLPDARYVWPYTIRIPTRTLEFLVPKPRLRAPVHEFDGEHYWEINTRNYSLNRVISDLSKLAELVSTYRVHENPYHRFFIFSVT